jgi:hypothetical protein
VKMDNFHLFEKVLIFFHTLETMGNEIYKQHGLLMLCILS